MQRLGVETYLGVNIYHREAQAPAEDVAGIKQLGGVLSHDVSGVFRLVVLTFLGGLAEHTAGR